MTRRRRIVIATLLTLLAQSVVPLASARDDDRGRQSDQRSDERGESGRGEAKGGISPGQAASIARSAYGGRVVSVQPGGDGGYKVRVLLDGGRVKTVRVDSRGSIRGSD